jgi:hypothetical protein
MKPATAVALQATKLQRLMHMRYDVLFAPDTTNASPRNLREFAGAYFALNGIVRDHRHVEHISGNISSTKYTPPECNTMRTYGLCVNMDSLCNRDWMKHPLIYYRVKRRDMEGKK